MPSPAKKFLLLLTDDTWHVFQRLPNGVGAATVERCIKIGFIRTKKIHLRRNGDLESFQIALRITERGKAALAD